MNIGDKHGYYEVIDIYYEARWTSSRRDKYVKARCKCGNIEDINNQAFKRRKILKCKKCRIAEKDYGDLCKGSIKTSHGMTGTRIFNIWTKMRDRVRNPTGKSACYAGITICNEWQDFIPFYEWATSNGYDDNLSIDRIDNTKGYCPENCRWTIALVQSQNRGIRKSNTSGYIGVFFSKPRNGTVRYKNIGRNPWYYIVHYNGNRWQGWGYKTAHDAHTARVQFVKDNGLIGKVLTV